MADGLKLHGAEPTFPTILKEEDFRDGRKDLKDKRQAYNAYNDVYIALKAKVANGSTMLYCLYVKKNPMLADFGLVPYKQTGVKGPRKQKRRLRSDKL